MRELVAMRVKILRGEVRRGGRTRVENLYPPFDEIPPERRTPPGSSVPMSWSLFFDAVGIGWAYDLVSGFGYSDDEEPDPGVLWGLVMVPEEFALEAEARWPDRIVILSPQEAESWYDRRVGSKTPPEILEAGVLSGLHASLQLAMELNNPQAEADVRAMAAKALDPDDETPGRQRNPFATFQGLTERKGVRAKRRSRPRAQ